MNQKAKKIEFKGVAAYQDEAASLIAQPGDVALVERGIPRALVFRCPCGCGDNLIVNLDRRAGPAWRFFRRTDGITLYPSYWRDSACGSHFILWDSEIYWCHGWHDEEEQDWWSVPADVEARVLNSLDLETFTPYWELADEIGLLPWEVLQACRQLVDKKLAERGFSRDEAKFRRR